ncbi:MAG: acyl-CoA dehydrogenase family protein [Pseudomonadota bacterium]
MPAINPHAALATHEVTNQPEDRGALPLWDGDAVLRGATETLGPDRRAALAAYAGTLGSEEMQAAARAANRSAPELRLFDAGGRRLDEVAFHPAYHTLLEKGLSAGYAATAWEDTPGGHLQHAAMVYLASQIEPGHCCPMTMTYAAVPALRGRAESWLPGIMARRYDPASRPAAQKAGVTIGMAMTEKQGGSDVRANTTRAEPDAPGRDQGWRLTGHKWFCSAPMSDGFLTLAQTAAGLSCFLVPRWTPDGARNALHLMRLKDKLGNRANASAEIEYHGAWAELLGEDGDGIRTILAMVHHTRLDTAMAPAGLMRRALTEAQHWVTHRTAFQRRLIDQPLMRAVLADLALDWIGAAVMGLRVARAFDAPQEAPLARILVAIAKYWSNKRCPQVIYEAMECMGGVGYVEDGIMPLLYREAPLNSIWEGSGNVICLDILRSLARSPDSAEALRGLLASAHGRDARYDAALAGVEAMLAAPAEHMARALTERLALLVQAALLLDGPDEKLAAAFIEARLGAAHHTHGAASTDTDAVLALL